MHLPKNSTRPISYSCYKPTTKRLTVVGCSLAICLTSFSGYAEATNDKQLSPNTVECKDSALYIGPNGPNIEVTSTNSDRVDSSSKESENCAQPGASADIGSQDKLPEAIIGILNLFGRKESNEGPSSGNTAISQEPTSNSDSGLPPSSTNTPSIPDAPSSKTPPTTSFNGPNVQQAPSSLDSSSSIDQSGLGGPGQANDQAIQADTEQPTEGEQAAITSKQSHSTVDTSSDSIPPTTATFSGPNVEQAPSSLDSSVSHSQSLLGEPAQANNQTQPTQGNTEQSTQSGQAFATNEDESVSQSQVSAGESEQESDAVSDRSHTAVETASDSTPPTTATFSGPNVQQASSSLDTDSSIQSALEEPRRPTSQPSTGNHATGTVPDQTVQASQSELRSSSSRTVDSSSGFQGRRSAGITSNTGAPASSFDGPNVLQAPSSLDATNSAIQSVLEEPWRPTDQANGVQTSSGQPNNGNVATGTLQGQNLESGRSGKNHTVSGASNDSSGLGNQPSIETASTTGSPPPDFNGPNVIQASSSLDGSPNTQATLDPSGQPTGQLPGTQEENGQISNVNQTPGTRLSDTGGAGGSGTSNTTSAPDNVSSEVGGQSSTATTSTAGVPPSTFSGPNVIQATSSLDATNAAIQSALEEPWQPTVPTNGTQSESGQLGVGNQAISSPQNPNVETAGSGSSNKNSGPGNDSPGVGSPSSIGSTSTAGVPPSNFNGPNVIEAPSSLDATPSIQSTLQPPGQQTGQSNGSQTGSGQVTGGNQSTPSSQGQSVGYAGSGTSKSLSGSGNKSRGSGSQRSIGSASTAGAPSSNFNGPNVPQSPSSLDATPYVQSAFQKRMPPAGQSQGISTGTGMPSTSGQPMQGSVNSQASGEISGTRTFPTQLSNTPQFKSHLQSTSAVSGTPMSSTNPNITQMGSSFDAAKSSLQSASSTPAATAPSAGLSQFSQAADINQVAKQQATQQAGQKSQEALASVLESADELAEKASQAAKSKSATATAAKASEEAGKAAASKGASSGLKSSLGKLSPIGTSPLGTSLTPNITVVPNLAMPNFKISKPKFAVKSQRKGDDRDEQSKIPDDAKPLEKSKPKVSNSRKVVKTLTTLHRISTVIENPTTLVTDTLMDKVTHANKDSLVLDDYARSLQEAYLAETDPTRKEALKTELERYLDGKGSQ